MTHSPSPDYYSRYGPAGCPVAALRGWPLKCIHSPGDRRRRRRRRYGFGSLTENPARCDGRLRGRERGWMGGWYSCACDTNADKIFQTPSLSSSSSPSPSSAASPIFTNSIKCVGKKRKLKILLVNNKILWGRCTRPTDNPK